jgi:fructokinase
MAGTHRIVGLGEVLWDIFPEGPRFGGAPANFACHAAALGGEVSMVSRVGADELGEAAVEFLTERGVDTSAVARSRDLPTGEVHVHLDDQHSPSYEIASPVAWDAIEWSSQLGELAATADAVCFGTLAQRNAAARRTILQFLRATPASALRVFDVNLRQSFYSEEIVHTSLGLANVLKLNEDELRTIAVMCNIDESSQVRQLLALCEEFRLRLAALTRGSQGSLIVSTQIIADCPGFPALVRDTVGAGDAFTAALTVGILAGRDVDDVNRQACRLAAYVCAQPGAVPSLPEELR